MSRPPKYIVTIASILIAIAAILILFIGPALFIAVGVMGILSNSIAAKIAGVCLISLGFLIFVIGITRTREELRKERERGSCGDMEGGEDAVP